MKKIPIFLVLSFLLALDIKAAPHPFSGAMGIPLDGDTLRWEETSGVSYDIYMTTDSNNIQRAGKSSKAYRGNSDNTFFSTGKLKAGTKYYWRIDKVSESGTVTKGDTNNYTATKSTLVTRLNGGKPIIHKDTPGALLEGSKASSHNINGPSFIRIPDWIPPEKRANPKAVYYLYFAHHGGKHIRLAWSEHIEGPYTVYNPGIGVFQSEDIKDLMYGHIASPDVHIDSINQRIIMYVHSSNDNAWPWGQSAVVGVSPYGLDFDHPHKNDPTKLDAVLSTFYIQVFEYKQQLMGITNFGETFRARHFDDPFNADYNQDGNADIRVSGKKRDYLWEKFNDRLRQPGDEYQGQSWRHSAVQVRGDTLDVWFTTRKARPERIRHTTIDLSVGIENWKLDGKFTDVLEPEMLWEGVDLKAKRSLNGAGIGLRELRDPEVFTDIDGKRYLFYTGRGEEAIGVAIFNDTKDLTPLQIRKKSDPSYWKPDMYSQHGSWHIGLDNEEKVTVSVYDTRGKLIMEKQRSGTKAISISQSGLNSAVYFLKLKYEGRAPKSYRLPPILE